MVGIAIISFAKFKTKQSRASMSAVMNYAMNLDKTLFDGECLLSGLNCSPQTVYHEFINTKLLYGKDEGRMYYHITQSFPKGEAVPPKIAHEMAVKLAEHFKDYEVLICTHLDRDHVHSHFIINSVIFDTGRKFHISTPDLEPIRQLNDNLCMEYGFEICKPKPKHKQTNSMSVAEYHAAAKGDSWKRRLMNTIDNYMKHAGSKAQFIELMELEGYSVQWTDSRKSITYTAPHGMKCRDDRLHETKYLKERMELELRIREQIIIGGTQTAEQTAATEPTPPQQPPHSCTMTLEKMDNLFYNQSLIWDGIVDLQNQIAAVKKQNQLMQTQMNSLLTKSALEQISKSLTQIQQTLAQAGKKKEKRFSVPSLQFPTLPWTPLWVVIPLTLVTLAVIWFSFGELWKGWITLLP